MTSNTICPDSNKSSENGKPLLIFIPTDVALTIKSQFTTCVGSLISPIEAAQPVKRDPISLIIFSALSGVRLSNFI